MDTRTHRNSSSFSLRDTLVSVNIGTSIGRQTQNVFGFGAAVRRIWETGELVLLPSSCLPSCLPSSHPSPSLTSTLPSAVISPPHTHPSSSPPRSNMSVLGYRLAYIPLLCLSPHIILRQVQLLSHNRVCPRVLVSGQPVSSLSPVPPAPLIKSFFCILSTSSPLHHFPSSHSPYSPAFYEVH